MKIKTKKDSLLKWVQREDGKVVDLGVATETKNPDGREFGYASTLDSLFDAHSSLLVE